MNNKYLAFGILIGGKSTRFGADKGLFKLRKKRLIEYQLEILQYFNFDIFLIANDKTQVQSYIDEIDFRIITGFIIDEYDFDLDPTMRSPMIGLYSAFKELRKLNYKKLYALSCDNPLIKKEVIDFLIQEIKEYECVIPRWKNQFVEPLFAIYPIEKAYYRSSECIKKQQFKLTNIIDDEWKIKFVSIEKTIRKLDPYLLSFKNINTNGDIEEIEKLFTNNN
ncbi:MAG: molybdenum cofactor guanylyltransferase [Promethearchaeota archaeon]|nr:MAG: molybdenum cofactor guanylyltransferase [Candidatus Lokiarchaeota archaeon]